MNTRPSEWKEEGSMCEGMTLGVFDEPGSACYHPTAQGIRQEFECCPRYKEGGAASSTQTGYQNWWSMVATMKKGPSSWPPHLGGRDHLVQLNSLH